MNFFKKKSTWSNIELGLLKICVGSIYIIVGVYFHKFLEDYLLFFAGLFIATAIPVWIIWMKQMKSS